MAYLILKDDSFEGSIEYSCIADELEKDEFNVCCAVRYGNLDGQGKMFLMKEGNASE